MNRKTKVQELEGTTDSKTEPKPKSSVKRTPRVTKTSKPIKETVETSLNLSKENLKKNIVELKDAATDVSKTTAKTVKKVSESAKKTITKTSDDLAKAVKTNISNIIGFDKKLYIEYYGKKVSEDELVERFKLEWTKSHKLSEIKDLKVYYKIEEDTAYYLVNDKETLSIKII